MVVWCCSGTAEIGLALHAVPDAPLESISMTIEIKYNIIMYFFILSVLLYHTFIILFYYITYIFLFYHFYYITLLFYYLYLILININNKI